MLRHRLESADHQIRLPGADASQLAARSTASCGDVRAVDYLAETRRFASANFACSVRSVMPSRPP